MRGLLQRRLAYCVLFCASACLDPLVTDALNPELIFGDPAVDITNAPHLEDDANYFDKTASFLNEIPYRQGYAQGARVWFWDVPNQGIDIIADIYIILHEGALLEAPIIDVIPGDAGYSPLWRKIFLNTTEAYQDEKIRSRAAIDLALDLGLLDKAQPSVQVVNCPVVSQWATVPLSNTSTISGKLSTGWYRNRRVSWATFSPASEVLLELRRIPVRPLYIIQRINEAMPIDEAVSGVDLDGDRRLLSSNTIFAGNVSERTDGRYSPIWQPWLVRTSSTYPSIDNSTEGPAYKAESDFIDLMTHKLRDRNRVGGGSEKSFVVSIEKLDGLVNCSIQKEKGKL